MSASAVPATGSRPVPPREPGGPTWDEVRRPYWHRVRLVVAVGWLVVLAALVVAGERQSSVSSLLGAAHDGDVGAVRVSGPGLSPDGRGYAIVEVRWRQGPFRLLAHVVEARPLSAGRSAYVDGEPRAVVTTDAVAYLRERTDGVRVTRDDDGFRSSGEVGGWLVPTWVAVGALLASVATLGLLVGGPRPWRATRWAWFWLVWSAAPVGVPAFLLLSGPVRGLPRPGGKVLTGGWAFLLAVVVLSPLLALAAS